MSEERVIAASPPAAGLAAGEASIDRIEQINLSFVVLPRAAPVSDAKVLIGRPKPLTEIALLSAQITSRAGHAGLGLSYSKRAVAQPSLRTRRRLRQI